MNDSILVCIMIIIVYSIMNHDYHGISHDFLLQILINYMFPWKTVGMPIHSSTSHVFCVQRMGDCRKTESTKRAR